MTKFQVHVKLLLKPYLTNVKCAILCGPYLEYSNDSSQSLQDLTLFHCDERIIQLLETNTVKFPNLKSLRLGLRVSLSYSSRIRILTTFLKTFGESVETFFIDDRSLRPDLGGNDTRERAIYDLLTCTTPLGNDVCSGV